MFDTWMDAMRTIAAGATGGLIYWAARTHGQIFSSLWTLIAKRRA